MGDWNCGVTVYTPRSSSTSVPKKPTMLRIAESLRLMCVGLSEVASSKLSGLPSNRWSQSTSTIHCLLATR